MKQPFPGVHQVLSGYVNAFVVESDDGLVLIDAGLPKSETRILRALARRGWQPHDVKHIIITHAHPDHMGGLAAMVKATGAQCWVHEADADAVEAGIPLPVFPGPGILAHLLFSGARMMNSKIAPARVDHRVKDGDVLPGGLVAVHAPGHSAGQIALIQPDQRLLFAADSVMNLWGLQLSFLNADREQAGRTAARIAGLDFDRALFGHGSPITQNAAEEFREAFVGP